MSRSTEPMTPPPRPNESNFNSPDATVNSVALISAQLEAAHALLFSPPVVQARRTSTKWSQPLSPGSLEQELQRATRKSRGHQLAQARQKRMSIAATQQPQEVIKEEEQVGQTQPPNSSPSIVPPTAIFDGTEPSPIEQPQQQQQEVAVEEPTELQLHLRDPVADDEGAKLLATTMINSAASLTSIKAFVQHVSEVGALALADALNTEGLALRTADMRFRDLELTGAATLCQSLVGLPRLESLTLRCCSLGDEGARWLCAAFLQSDMDGCSRLTHLDLNENGITDIGCLAIGQLLMRHHSLTHLSLEENSIGTRGAYVLGKAMAGYRTRLPQPDSPVLMQQSVFAPDDAGAVTSPRITSARTSLAPAAAATTSASNSGFTSPVARKESSSVQPFPVPVPFTPAVPQRRDSRAAATGLPSSLEETIEEDPESLDNSHSNNEMVVRRKSSAVPIDATEEAILHSGHLNEGFMNTLDSLPSSTANSRRSSMAYSRRPSGITTHPSAAAASLLDDHPCVLQILNLRYNKIDVNDMSVIAPNGVPTANFSQPQSILARYLTVAPETTGLVQLDLSLNSMGDEGAVVLARSLAHNLSLTSLNLNYCHISDRGGIALARALAFNTSLTSFYLSLNYLTTLSATSFSDSLSINETLATLDLSLNLLDDMSIWCMNDAIGLNRSLTSLDLHSNFISDEGAEGLGQAILLNTTLKYVNADENPMSEDGFEVIALTLKHEGRGTGAIPYSPVDAAARRIRLQTKISELMAKEEK